MYQQLPVTPETAAVLTMNTLKGLYNVRCLSFSVAAVLAIFQLFMDTTLKGIPGTCAYLEDIVVSRATREERASRLGIMLNRLKTQVQVRSL